jgi:stearoyl-CoA desaturase (delta-9 desaturase)
MISHIFISRFASIRGLYAFNTLASLFYIFTYGITLNNFWVVLCVWGLMSPLGIAIVYHRYWSHRSFEFRNSLLKYLCTLPSLVSGTGSILGWVGIHREHHSHSDTEDDPHPASKGYVPLITMQSYEYKPNAKRVVDLLRDEFIATTHAYYFAFPLTYALLCFSLFGFAGLVFGFCMPAALNLLTQNTTNYINHLQEDKYGPTNVWWINIFNFGDGWHKNHHDNPKSYTTSNKWYQLDPAGIVIKYLLAKKGSICYG